MTYKQWLDGLPLAVRTINNEWTRPASYELKKLNIIKSNTYADYCISHDEIDLKIRNALIDSWKKWVKDVITNKVKVDYK